MNFPCLGMRSVAVLALGAAAGILGCSDDEPGGVSSAADDIVGGSDALDPDLTAVGAIMMEKGGVLQNHCTGSLISANVVLTARHCLVGGPGVGSWELPAEARLSFAIGHDSHRANRRVKIRSAKAPPRVAGGVNAKGPDVGLYVLEEPIADVEPIRVSGVALTEADVGTTFVGVGYGLQDLARTTAGTRKKIEMKLGALDGHPYRHEYGTREEWIAVNRAGFDAANMGAGARFEEFAGELDRLWDSRLLPGYEVYLPAPAKDACVLKGDSGGPLLRREGSEWVIFGVVSQGVRPRFKPTRCHGEIYGAFGPVVAELLRESVTLR